MLSYISEIVIKERITRYCGTRAEVTTVMSKVALGLSETVLGKEHPDTLVSMSNLANVLSDQVRYRRKRYIDKRFSLNILVFVE